MTNREAGYISWLEKEVERQNNRANDYHNRILAMLDYLQDIRKLNNDEHLELLKIAFPE